MTHRVNIPAASPSVLERVTRRMVAIALHDIYPRSVAQHVLAEQLALPEDVVRDRVKELWLVGWAVTSVGAMLNPYVALTDQGHVGVAQALRDTAWADDATGTTLPSPTDTSADPPQSS